MGYTSCNWQIPMIMPKTQLEIKLFTEIYDFQNLQKYFYKFKDSRTRILLWIGNNLDFKSKNIQKILDQILSMNLYSLSNFPLIYNGDISKDFSKFLLDKKIFDDDWDS